MDDTELDDFDDEDDENYGESDHFDPVIPENKRLKAYQTPFKCYSPRNILDFQENEIAHVNGIVGGSLETSGILI